MTVALLPVCRLSTGVVVFTTNTSKVPGSHRRHKTKGHVILYGL